MTGAGGTEIQKSRRDTFDRLSAGAGATNGDGNNKGKMTGLKPVATNGEKAKSEEGKQRLPAVKAAAT